MPKSKWKRGYAVQHRYRLSAEQLAALRTAAEDSSEPTVAKRAQMLLAFLGGESAAHVAEAFGAWFTQVYQYLHRFEQDGIQGLRDKKSGRSGISVAMTEEAWQVVRTAVSRPPSVYGFKRRKWSLEALSHVIYQKCGISISAGYLGRLMRERHIDLWAVKTLTERELQEINALTLHPKEQVRRRAEAILLVHEGKTLQQAADVFGVTREAVRQWWRSYKAFGLTSVFHPRYTLLRHLERRRLETVKGDRLPK